MKRSGKWYRRNEADVMRSLGLEPTPNSGSGWVVKEDGQSERIICQLKSTDAASIKVQHKDLQTLEYNAAVSHKIPVFAVQFISSGELYLMVKPIDLCDVAELVKTGKCSVSQEDLSGLGDSMPAAACKPSVRSSKSAREIFNSEYDKKFRKEKKSAL